MIVQSIPIPSSLTIPVQPLTRSAFSPFGTAISNPSPSSLPHNTSPASIANGALPHGAVSANQGTAIQYRALEPSFRNYYDTHSESVRSGVSPNASPRMTMFVCGARDLGERAEFEVKVLERHPFTSQTFIPLTADKSRRYLVIVAPTLPSVDGKDKKLPAPKAKTAASPAAGSNGGNEKKEKKKGEDVEEAFKLPGAGLPDLTKLTAFIATAEQAVTYGAGTWHAPMVALGPPGTAIDFVVVQFANDVPIEDCQEVELEGEGKRIAVTVPMAPKGLWTAKL